LQRNRWAGNNTINCTQTESMWNGFNRLWEGVSDRHLLTQH